MLAYGTGALFISIDITCFDILKLQDKKLFSPFKYNQFRIYVIREFPIISSLQFTLWVGGGGVTGIPRENTVW